MSTISSTIQDNVNVLRNLMADTLPGSNYEVEIRFNSYNQHHGITFRQYHLVKNYLDNLNLKLIMTDTRDDIMSYNTDTIQRGTLRRTSESTGGVYFILKYSALSEPIYNTYYKLNYTVNIEKPVNVTNFTPTLIRNKRRYRYQYNAYHLIDLTEVKTTFKNKQNEIVQNTSFELELEITPKDLGNPDAYTNLSDTITNILKILHDTENLYTINDYTGIVNFFNTTMKTGRDISRSDGMVAPKINHKMLFQARNLNAVDMVTGGLTGNKDFNYNVTVKADGERKLLIIHSSGIWLLMGPDQANLVYIFGESELDNPYEFSDKYPTGSILEGELIPINNRKDGAPIVKYWFLVFDCLSQPSIENDVGDISVQKRVHTDRLRVASRIKTSLDIIKSELMEVHVKEFKGFNSACELFQIIEQLELRKNNNHYLYNDDGYIFMANNMVYDYTADYSGQQTIIIYWYKIGNNVWQNNWGSKIVLKNYVLQEFSEKGVHKVLSDDAEWYTKISLKYVLKNNRWVPNTQYRTWTTTNFNKYRNVMKGSREARERNNTIEMVDGHLWQTINIWESGRKHVSKIPLYLRKLTKYPDICKWKPPSKLTIDFVTYRHKNISSGSLGKIQLYVSGFDNTLIPFTGTPHHPFITDPEKQPYGPVDSDHDLTKNVVNGITVVEYGWNYDTKTPMMVPKRIRHDKTRPNTMAIANAVWSNIQNPIDIQAMKGNSFIFMRKYHNRIKWTLFSQLFGSSDNEYTLLDIGSGMGGDSLKMTKAKRIVMVEPDDEHINELQRRLRSVFHQYNTVIISPGDLSMEEKISLSTKHNHKVVIVKTIGEDHDTISKVVKLWLGGPADRLSMMLSLSFFWKDKDNLNNLAKTILTNLKPDGRGIFFTIDGRIVHQTFNPTQIIDPSGFDSNLMISSSNICVDNSCVNISSSSSTKLNNRSPEMIQLESNVMVNKNKSNINTIGGQRYHYDTLKLGSAILKYSSKEDSLYINIPDSIVDEQQEWLVYLDELSSLLSEKFQITNTVRADQETFMSVPEYKLSNMYTGGHIYPINEPLGIDIPKSRKLRRFAGPVNFRLHESQLSSSKKGDLDIYQNINRVESDVSPISSDKLSSDVSQLPDINSAKDYDITTTSNVTTNIIHTSDVVIPTDVNNNIVTTDESNNTVIFNKDNGGVSVLSPSKISKIKPILQIKPTLPPTETSLPTETTLKSSPIKQTSQIKPTSSSFSVSKIGSDKQDILPMLPIRYNFITGKGDGDDVTEKLNVEWYKQHAVVRIATIADGSCFFHGILKAFYEPYANTSDYNERKEIVKELRRDLAASLTQLDKRYENKNYYQTANNGNLEALFLEIGSISNLGFNPSLEGMQTFFNSYADIGDESYQYVSDMLGIDIYIIMLTKQNMIPILLVENTNADIRNMRDSSSSSNAISENNSFIVVIAANGKHYETVGIDMGKQGIQTVFKPNDPFIKAIKMLYIKNTTNK